MIASLYQSGSEEIGDLGLVIDDWGSTFAVRSRSFIAITDYCGRTTKTCAIRSAGSSFT